MEKRESSCKSNNVMTVNVDWLQVFCLGAVVEDSTEILVCGKRMVTKLEDVQTPLFLRVSKIVDMSCGRRVATLLQCPRNKVINDRASMIKLENRVLYCEAFVDILYALISGLGLKYKGITRLDLCCDFNKFFDGTNPQRFIKAFLTKREGETGDIVRVGSNKFFVVGDKGSTTESVFNSIRFGTFRSKVGAYMYDKTLELREVKDKPWIRKVWERAGLVSDDSVHVWRVELSISSEGTDVLNMGTGDLFKLSPQFLDIKESVERLFRIYASKHFHFRRCEGQKCKRNYSEIDLFGQPEMVCRPYNMSKAADTGRMEKMCYNKISKLMEEYSDIAGTDVVGLNAALKFLLILSEEKRSIYNNIQNTNALKNMKGRKFRGLTTKDYFESLKELQRSQFDFTHMDLDAAWEIAAMFGVAEEFPMDVYDEYCKTCLPAI